MPDARPDHAAGPAPLATLDLEVTVRYVECDPMNVVHHSVYPIWMEMARTEMLRKQGLAYRDLEAQGIFFVVARLSIRYRRPARYDDQLRIHCKLIPSGGVKVEHEYEIYRGGELLAEAATTLVCVDRQGVPRRLPEGLLA